VKRRNHYVKRASIAAVLCMAAALVTFGWPLVAAHAAATLTVQHVEGTGGEPFSLEAPLGTGIAAPADAADFRQVIFQLSAADVAAVSPGTQVVDTPATGPLDPGPVNVSKTFLSFGGNVSGLADNPDVTVQVLYDIDNGSSGGAPTWQVAGQAAPDGSGDFSLALTTQPRGTTIAYQIRITAPAVVMSTAVTINQIAITYAYVAPAPTPTPTKKSSPKASPKPSPKPSPKHTTSAGGGSGQSGGGGSDVTGTGTGTGSGNGSGGGAVSGAAPNSSSATTHHGAARARTAPALPRSPAASAAGLVSGYVLAAPQTAAVSTTTGDHAAAGSAAPASGGQAASSAANTTRELGYAGLAACALLAVVAPWPLASRRLRSLIAFDHSRPAATGGNGEWREEPERRV
jgi:hypothetical protein